MTRSLILSTALMALAAGGAFAQAAAPAQEAPAQAAPGQAAPAETAPAQTAPAEATPMQAAPAQDVPAATAPAEAPADAAAAPATPADQTGAAPATAEPAAGGTDATAEEASPSVAPATGAPAAPAAPMAEVPKEGATEGDNHAAISAPAGEHAEPHVTDYAFSFEGPFGAYDQHQLQRGLQVYTQVCSACHGLRYVPIRTLGDEHGPGIPEDQVRAYAAGMDVFDPTMNDGQGDTRPATPNDHFPHSGYPGAPDLSLMAKARAGFHGPYGLGVAQLFRGIGGPEYIATLLTSYTGETKEEAGAVFYENTAFPGGWIAMPPPLAGDDVDYEDGTSTEIHQEAQDIAAFLMWTAEPKMMQRKQAGFSAVLMLGILSVLLYFTNKRIWGPVKHRTVGTAAE